ncbi:uncharacterized protein [Physeter macrocephalus]|uniref:Uncharacterized protein n=1 Tax=Physeter macrocephalus TaxID=9755 RepID=A0A9W2WQR5_PHYMC|nr:uncharacterized protein LOC129392185 [Physeter catodon]
MGTPPWSWQIAYWGPFSPASAFFQLVTVFCVLRATIQMRAILGPHFTGGETEAWSKHGSGSETPRLGKPCSCSPSCDAHAEGATADSLVPYRGRQWQRGLFHTDGRELTPVCRLKMPGRAGPRPGRGDSTPDLPPSKGPDISPSTSSPVLPAAQQVTHSLRAETTLQPLRAPPSWPRWARQDKRATECLERPELSEQLQRSPAEGGRCWGDWSGGRTEVRKVKGGRARGAPEMARGQPPEPLLKGHRQALML